MFALKGPAIVSAMILALAGMTGSAKGEEGTGKSFREIAEAFSDVRPGSKAVSVETWADRPEHGAFREGDRVVFSVKADARAYLTVLSLNPEGTVAVVFPNAQTPDNSLDRGKVRTLFGDDGSVRVRAAGARKGARLIGLVTSAPLDLEGLGLSGEPFATIRTVAPRVRAALRERIRAAARGDKGFNRIILALPGGVGDRFQLETVAATKEMGPEFFHKRVPKDIVSEPPESITGQPGARPTPIKEQ